MNINDIKVGTKIKMRSPDSRIRVVVCHIQAIIPDPANDFPEGQVIVYRYWSKYTKCWYWKASPYWQLAIWNNWECEMI
jgi:hypothetical protein